MTDVIRQSDLINQVVLDRTTMEELGRIEVLWMYPQKHRVLGFVCKSGFLGSKKTAFKLAQITAMGGNGILTHSPPEETQPDKVKKLESLLYCEVWSNAGNRVGKIIDCLFNLKTGTITHYLFVSSGWEGIIGEIYQLPPSQVMSFGRKRVLVAEDAIRHFTLYKGGIKQALHKAGDLLKDEYEQATQELRSLAKKAQTNTQRARSRFENLTHQAKERAQAISQQARQRAESISEQLREESQEWVQQAREKSQELAEQMKERSHNLTKQVEEGFQTLTVQAEEIFEAPVDYREERDRDDRAPDPTDLDWDEIFDFDDDPDSAPETPANQRPRPKSSFPDWDWEEEEEFVDSPTVDPGESPSASASNPVSGSVESIPGPDRPAPPIPDQPQDSPSPAEDPPPQKSGDSVLLDEDDDDPWI